MIFRNLHGVVGLVADTRSGLVLIADGNRKDKDYNAIISAKNLDLHYQSVTFGTFGSFGTGTWSVITKACDPTSHPK